MNSTELLEASFQRCPDALLWCDEKGDIVKVNEGFAAMFGYDVATALKGNLGLVNPTFRSEIWRAHWNELLESGTKRVQHELRRSDGTLFQAVMSECMVVSDGRVLNFQIIQDDVLRQNAISVQKDTELLYAMILDVGGWGFGTGTLKPERCRFPTSGEGNSGTLRRSFPTDSKRGAVSFCLKTSRRLLQRSIVTS